jgi:HK97 family phage major capsid protein
MERVPELGVKLEEKRQEVTAILAAARKRGDAMTAAERTLLAALTEEIHGLDATLRAEQEALSWDRTGAVPIGRRTDGADAEDREPALALPPLPARTRRKLEAMAAGASMTATAGREHFAAVVQAALGGNPFHPSLVPLAASGTEAVPSEGGFAVAPEYAAGIWVRAAEQSVWFRIGVRVEMMTSDSKTIPALDDDDETSDAEAALAAAWTAEGVDQTPQVMRLRAVTLSAKKLMIVAAGSGELAEDGPGYFDELELAIARGIAKKLDRACFSGTGAGQPTGVINSPATVVVSKTVDSDPGTANTFTWKHAAGMWSRMAPGSHENAWWIAHPTVLPQMLSMHLTVKNVAGAENVGGFQPVGAFAPGGPTGYMLLGRPVVISGRVKPLSSQGDVVLVDPTQYAIGIRRSIVVDRSPHVYFTSDRIAVRGKFRGDGLTLWETPRTLQEGSTTVSPYVVLAAR